MTVLVVPVCSIACLLAPWLLRLAGGTEYLSASVTVLRILAIGVAANCIVAVPFTLLQASGHARTTATLHLIEIIPFVLLLWFAVTRYGIVGAAAAWTTRVLVDAALMAWRAQAIAPLATSTLVFCASGITMVAASAWLGAAATESSRMPLMAACLMVFAIPAALWSQRNSAERLVVERFGGAS
jgi:O-antigen/teichoic acid export membrane protein